MIIITLLATGASIFIILYLMAKESDSKIWQYRVGTGLKLYCIACAAGIALLCYMILCAVLVDAWLR